MKEVLTLALFIILLLTSCTGGPPATLNSADPDLRRQAVYNLSRSAAASEYFADFVALLESDPDYLVKAQCAVALGKLKNPLALPALVKALSNPQPIVRVDVVKALGEIGDAQIIPSLQALLTSDGSVLVRRAIVQTLGKIGNRESLPNLIQALKDSDDGVTEIAYQILREMTKQDLSKDITSWENWYNSNK